MPLSFQCPSCQTKLRIAEDNRGKQIRCPKCSTVLRVPETAAAPEPPPARSAPPKNRPAVVAAKKPPVNENIQADKNPSRRPVDRPRPRRDNKPIKSKDRSWLIAGIAVACGGGILCLALGIGLIVWLVKKGPNESQTVQNNAPALNQPAQPPGGLAIRPPAPRPEPPAPQRGPAVLPAAPPPAPPPASQPIVHAPEGPTPAQLDAATLRKVKQATVYLRVELPNGSAAEGSGFLCAAPRIVITNAHVLGMLRGDSAPPTRVDVVLHSGEAGEKKTTAAVLGVDRTNDLAVLRLPDELAPLPEPLPVDSANKLFETQKVYIFGFPFGAQLGKNITVSESSVSSLRRDDSGTLNQVQVNGGMSPGNSGGPVTDARGVVIGVSVAIMRGTQVNFAIPGDLVQQVLDGRFAANELGSAYQTGGRIVLPVKMTCLDPLRRIRQVKLDVWAGAAGAARPASPRSPQPQSSDGPRSTHNTVFRDGAYCLDVPLPSLQPGQVCWLQPVLVKASGQSEWAKAAPVPAEAQIIVERKPASLHFKPPKAAIERTLELNSDVALTVYQNKEDTVFREKMDGKVLESLSPDPRGLGTSIRLTLADCPFTREAGGKTLQPPPSAVSLLKQFSPTFMVTNANACKERGKRNFNGLAPDQRQTVEGLYETLCNTYESTTLPLPSRMLNPLETWTARMPMFVLARGKRQIQDIHVTCTYEGVHATNDGTEAHIALSGVVKGRGPRAGGALGKARGLARFHVEKGFFTLVHLTVSSEVEVEESGVRVMVNDHSIVKRREGNQLGIAAATRNQPPVQPGAQNQPGMQPGMRNQPGLQPGRRPPMRRPPIGR